jgi:beta-lactamase regulating signal transducer with metallopeptidase domain/Tol biopolymer transport system component
MNQTINDCLAGLNSIGEAFCGYAAGAFVQSALLIVLLFALDLLLRQRVRAVFRYCVWLLVLVKLVLPPTLSLPTGIGYWVGDHVPAVSPVSERVFYPMGHESLARPQPPAAPASDAIIPVQPATTAVTPAAPVTPPSVNVTPLTWQAIVFLFWVAGVLAFIALLAQRLRFVRGLVAASIPAGSDLLGLLEQCRRQTGVRRQVGLRMLDTLPSPAVCGLLRPTVLMPTSLVEKLSPEGLRAALIHELAHIKRADLWINAVQTFLQVVYFYNPFVWFANAIIRRTCEEAVDETVLVTLGGEAKSYSNTLIDIGEMAFWKADFGLRLVGVAESRKALQWRIKHMLTRPVPQSTRIGVLGTITMVVVAAVLLPMARAERSNKDVSPNPQATAAKVADKALPAGESDTIVDPNTGLKFTAAKKIAGANDVIESDSGIIMSPNGKFLLWRGRVVPLDGSPAFTLKELKGASIASWSPDGQKIAFNFEGIEVLPVSAETGRPAGPGRKLLQGANWFRGRIYWSTDLQRILFIKWNPQIEREVGSIALGDGRLNKEPDYGDFGVLSPDGKTMAYSMYEDGIWTRPAGGGVTRIARVRRNTLLDEAVVWTSDSQWVVSATGRDMPAQLHFARPADGNGFDMSPPEAAGRFVGKSLDGKKLCFYRSAFDPRAICRIVPVSGGPALDGGPVVLEASEDVRFWSPDSASLAVLRMDQRARPSLWSTRLPGGDRVQFNLQPLGAGPGPFLLSLSPDSRKLFYLALRPTDQGGREPTFYVVPISLKEGRTTGPAVLILNKEWQNQFAGMLGSERVGLWSPDGTRIAAPRGSEQGHELWVLFADGSTPVRIAQTPDGLATRLRWSPDGRMIAFNLSAPEREILQVIPWEGGTPKTVLTMPKGQAVAFGWAPDSKEIVAAYDGTISSLSLTGGGPRVIARLQEAGYESASWVCWSPDGQRLAFYGERVGEPGRLCLLAPSTGKIVPLESSPKKAWSFAWSPDSKMISCTSEEAQKTRPAGVIRELEIAATVQKVAPVAEKKPTASKASTKVEPIAGPVFTDTFDNGISKYWRMVECRDEGLPCAHVAENGVLVLAHTSAHLDSIDWSDYVVKVRLCIKEAAPSGEGVLAVEVRTTPSPFGGRDRYTLVLTCVNGNPALLALGACYNDSSKKLQHAVWKRVGPSFVRDQWYTVELEVRGQQVRGYLDGKLVIEATDARLSKGGIWLTAWRSRVLLDDFSVRLLP